MRLLFTVERNERVSKTPWARYVRTEGKRRNFCPSDTCRREFKMERAERRGAKLENFPSFLLTRRVFAR